MSELFEFLSKGGFLMIPIAACSVLGLTFFIERLWSLQRPKILPARFLEIVSRLLQERRFTDAEALCMQHDNPAAAVLGAGIRYAGRDRGLIKEVMEEAGRREVFYMERFTNALGAISTISPLLGLLGTVVGLIRMFQRVVGSADAGQSMVDVGLLASGIWQALITTAAGLAVAIPIFLAYRYVLSRVDRYAVEIEDVCLKALDLLVAQEQTPTVSLSPEAAAASPAARRAAGLAQEPRADDAEASSAAASASDAKASDADADASASDGSASRSPEAAR